MPPKKPSLRGPKTPWLLCIVPMIPANNLGCVLDTWKGKKSKSSDADISTGTAHQISVPAHMHSHSFVSQAQLLSIIRCLHLVHALSTKSLIVDNKCLAHICGSLQTRLLRHTKHHYVSSPSICFVRDHFLITLTTRTRIVAPFFHSQKGPQLRR